MSKWTLTPIYRFPSLFLRAESPVNNHYLLKTLPFPPECRKEHGGVEIPSLGFSLKTSRMESKEINWERTWNIPYIQPSWHTHKAEKYTHTPLFISTVSRDLKTKTKNPGVFRTMYLFSIHWTFTHTLAHPLPIHQTQAARFAERSLYTPPGKMCSQKLLLQPKERSGKLPACLPFCFVADSLHSPLLPVSQCIF